MHIDNWLECPAHKDDGERYAKFVLSYFRYPAWMIVDFNEWMKQFKLFCTYEDKRYRCTGASRMGDIWLASDHDRETGYDLRVDVEECSNWSSKP